jgi:hypothetical protein
VLSLEVESEGFTESYFLLASDCHRTPLKIGIGTLLLTQLIVTKKEAFQLLFNCGIHKHFLELFSQRCRAF